MVVRPKYWSLITNSRPIMSNNKWGPFPFNLRLSLFYLAQIAHTWTPYCSAAPMDVALPCVRESLRIYSTVYLVSHTVPAPEYSISLSVRFHSTLKAVFRILKIFTQIRIFRPLSRVYGLGSFINLESVEFMNLVLVM